MSMKGYAYRTVNSHIYAISFYNKLNSFKDETNFFVVKKLLEGMRRTQSRKDSRKPISAKLLQKISNSLHFVCKSGYEQVLFTVAFQLAFYGLLRVSEITFPISGIRYTDSKFTLLLPFSKTDQLRQGTLIEIPLTCFFSGNLKNNLDHYKKIRPNCAGQFLCHANGLPLTPYQFRSVLKKSMAFLDIKDSAFHSHSFRIGGASYLYSKGLAESDIQKYGRWKSSAYKTYIRPF